VRALVIASAALALASAFAGAAASRSASGLRGIVMRGPTTPVCRVGVPCDEPAKGLLLQFKRDGRIRARVRTSQTGWYRVRLRPGKYAVSSPALRPGQELSPRTARAPRGRLGRVDLYLDTGLR
jgi:hypothetical protein